MAETTDYSSWITKQQAADALQVSTKHIEKLAKQHRLDTRMYLRPKGGNKIRVYNPKDVDQLKKESEIAPAFPLPEGLAVDTIPKFQATIKSAQDGVIATIDQRVARLQAMFTPPPTEIKRLFVTVQEAAEITGLPEALVRKAIWYWEKTNSPADCYETGRLRIPALLSCFPKKTWTVRFADPLRI